MYDEKEENLNNILKIHPKIRQRLIGGSEVFKKRSSSISKVSLYFTFQYPSSK
jgi:hypothetical protein